MLCLNSFTKKVIYCHGDKNNWVHSVLSSRSQSFQKCQWSKNASAYRKSGICLRPNMSLFLCSFCHIQTALKEKLTWKLQTWRWRENVYRGNISSSVTQSCSVSGLKSWQICISHVFGEISAGKSSRSVLAYLFFSFFLSFSESLSKYSCWRTQNFKAHPWARQSLNGWKPDPPHNIFKSQCWEIKKYEMKWQTQSYSDLLH